MFSCVRASYDLRARAHAHTLEETLVVDPGKKNRFSRKTFEKISVFSGNLIKKKSIFQVKFPTNFDFFDNFTKNCYFPGKIGYLQLFLGKLFYFSSKVTTFEHTSCT